MNKQVWTITKENVDKLDEDYAIGLARLLLKRGKFDCEHCRFKGAYDPECSGRSFCSDWVREEV